MPGCTRLLSWAATRLAVPIKVRRATTETSLATRPTPRTSNSTTSTTCRCWPMGGCRSRLSWGTLGGISGCLPTLPGLSMSTTEDCCRLMSVLHMRTRTIQEYSSMQLEVSAALGLKKIISSIKEYSWMVDKTRTVVPKLTSLCPPTPSPEHFAAWTKQTEQEVTAAMLPRHKVQASATWLSLLWVMKCGKISSRRRGWSPRPMGRSQSMLTASPSGTMATEQSKLFSSESQSCSRPWHFLHWLGYDSCGFLSSINNQIWFLHLVTH